MLAVACGGARGWRDDLDRVTSIVTPDLYVATNETGTVLDPLHHWVTLHPNKMSGWEGMRLKNGLPKTYETWSHGNRPPMDHALGTWHDGSSGLLAVGAALKVGADMVVCCGIRLDEYPNAFRDEDRWRHHMRYRKGWQRHMAELEGKVYSMSGWTRELLGPPPFLTKDAA